MTALEQRSLRRYGSRQAWKVSFLGGGFTVIGLISAFAFKFGAGDEWSTVSGPLTLALAGLVMLIVGEVVGVRRRRASTRSD